MGLQIHSLDGMNQNHIRDYYVYLLEFNWYEPLGELLNAALMNNYENMADISSQDEKSVVIKSTRRGLDFSDEVLSYHSINGEEDPDMLPAILITNRHPKVFKKRAKGLLPEEEKKDLKLVLVPLRRYCTTTNDVIKLVTRLFAQIKEGKDLNHFVIADVRQKGVDGALVDSITLAPTRGNAKVPVDKILNFVEHKTIHMTVNTITNTVNGSGNSINTAAGHTVEQTNNVHIITADEYKKLNDLGVPQNKLDELKEIQVECAAAKDKESLTKKVYHWLGEVSAHVAAIGLAHNIPAIMELVHHSIK